MTDDALRTLTDWVSKSRKAVFFGGAGVSTESGIPDFRSADGLYNQKYRHPPETIISHSFFVSCPEEFFRFYRERMIYKDALPNAAHRKLAEWEKDGRLTAVVTQNIDGLHQAAGSRNVLELHGSVHRNYCQCCGKFFGVEAILGAKGVPVCDCGGVIKPDVVLYEEGLDDEVWSKSVRAISEADLLIVGGTSLSVYPAAGLIDAYCGNRLVLINRDATPRDAAADLVIRGRIGEALSKIY